MIERKCQSCNIKKDRNLMIKITKLKDGLKINPSSKELGRSMYVCSDVECIKKLIKKKRIKSALKYYNQEEITRIEQELLRLVQV